MTECELRRIATSVGARRGWDFSRMRETQEPVPWDYADIARAYLAPDSHVLRHCAQVAASVFSLWPIRFAQASG